MRFVGRNFLMGRSSRPKPARLAAKLAHIRSALGLTLEQMIQRLDYKESPLYPTNLSAMERGEREPPLPLILAFARCVGISTDYLIDDSLTLPDRLPTTSQKRTKK